MNEAILTIRSLAEYLRIDAKTVYRMAQAGELPGFKVRRQWRFKCADVDLWIESKKSTARVAPMEPGDRPRHGVGLANQPRETAE